MPLRFDENHKLTAMEWPWEDWEAGKKEAGYSEFDGDEDSVCLRVTDKSGEAFPMWLQIASWGNHFEDIFCRNALELSVAIREFRPLLDYLRFVNLRSEIGFVRDFVATFRGRHGDEVQPGECLARLVTHHLGRDYFPTGE